MRLKEEKTLMFLEIIGLVIILATICFDVANNAIDQRQSEITVKALHSVTLAIGSVESRQDSFIEEFNRLFQLQQIIPEHQIDEKHETPDFKEMVDEFHKNKNNNKLLEKEIQIFTDQAASFTAQYNTQIDELNKLSNDNKMVFWENFKMIANDIRILAVIIGMFFYLKLYISIRERTK